MENISIHPINPDNREDVFIAQMDNIAEVEGCDILVKMLAFIICKTIKKNLSETSANELETTGVCCYISSNIIHDLYIEVFNLIAEYKIVEELNHMATVATSSLCKLTAETLYNIAKRTRNEKALEIMTEDFKLSLDGYVKRYKGERK